MRKVRRAAAVALPLLLAAALATSCRGTKVKFFDETIAGGEARPDAPEVPRVRYAAGLPIASWDPNGPDGWCEATAFIHARLLMVGGDGVITSDLAERWETSEDGLAVTLHLAPKATFHDGTPVMAADVVATWRSLARHERSEARSLLAAVSAMEAAGEREVLVRLSRPEVELPEALAEMAILPARALEGPPADPAALPVGAGAWRVAALGPKSVILEPHAGHHRGRASLGGVELMLVEDDRLRARRIADGLADLGAVPAASAAMLAGRESVRVQAFESGVIRAIPLDVRAPGLDDPRVRRALSALVDREKLVREALDGRGRPAWQFLSRRNPAYDPELDRPALDAAEARRLLDEAGWRRGASGVLERDGQPLRVRLVAWQGESFRRAAAASVVADWVREGVAAEVIEVDHAGYKRLADDLHGNAEGYVGGWSGLLAPRSVLAKKFASGGVQNRTGFSDAEIDRGLEEASRARTLGEAAEALRKVQRRVAELVPWIPLVHPELLFARNVRLPELPFRVVDSWYEFPRLLPAAGAPFR